MAVVNLTKDRPRKLNGERIVVANNKGLGNGFSVVLIVVKIY